MTVMIIYDFTDLVMLWYSKMSTSMSFFIKRPISSAQHRQLGTTSQLHIGNIVYSQQTTKQWKRRISDVNVAVLMVRMYALPSGRSLPRIRKASGDTVDSLSPLTLSSFSSSRHSHQYCRLLFLNLL